MSDARLERNYKMAHSASPNVSLPPSKAYLANYDAIFKKKTKPKPKKK